jgi:ribosome-associated translation inhibitor RaiA
MNEPTKYELLQSMASRRREMEAIDNVVVQLEEKIKNLKEKREELKSLNFLDHVLLKELYNGTD